MKYRIVELNNGGFEVHAKKGFFDGIIFNCLRKA